MSDIQAKVFTPTCAVAGCHSGNNPDGQLSLEDGNTFANLVNAPAFRTAAANAGKLRVVPGDPDNSFLIQKLEDTLVGGEGSAMPLGNRFVSDQAKQAIRDWISNGAPEN